MRILSIQNRPHNNGRDLPKYDWPKKPEKTAFSLTQSQDFLDGKQDIFDLLLTSKEAESMTK